MTAPAEPFIITNARVFDNDAGTLRLGIDVRVEGKRIVAVGTDLPRDRARTVDASGQTLLPGLIDCHVHLTMPGEATFPMTSDYPLSRYAWQAANGARLTLAAGYTTVRDLGAAYAVNCDLMRAVQDGLVEGPRIVPVGKPITMTGGHGWPIGREADGPDDVRKAVRENLKAGAKAIKLMASGGVMTPNVDPRSAQLGLEELRAGVEEAHKAGVKASTHAQANAGIRNAVLAGIDSVEHGIFMDDEILAEMKQRGTYFVPTLAAPMNINRLGAAAGVAPFVLEKARMIGATHSESVRAALRVGVRFAAGTDAGTPGNLHGENAQELRLLVAEGMSPLDALRAATVNAADLCSLGGETGQITPGLFADLLLIRGDPLEDISVLERPENILAVYLEGRLVHAALSGQMAVV